MTELRDKLREDGRFDPIERARHYNAHASGVEVIVIVGGMNFNVGNAFKYLARRNEKGAREENLGKALWYAKRELERRKEDAARAAVAFDDATDKWMAAEDGVMAQLYGCLLDAYVVDKEGTEPLETFIKHLEQLIAGEHNQEKSHAG